MIPVWGIVQLRCCKVKRRSSCSSLVQACEAASVFMPTRLQGGQLTSVWTLGSLGGRFSLDFQSSLCCLASWVCAIKRQKGCASRLRRCSGEEVCLPGVGLKKLPWLGDAACLKAGLPNVTLLGAPKGSGNSSLRKTVRPTPGKELSNHRESPPYCSSVHVAFETHLVR